MYCRNTHDAHRECCSRRVTAIVWCCALDSLFAEWVLYGHGAHGSAVHDRRAGRLPRRRESVRAARWRPHGDAVAGLTTSGYRCSPGYHLGRCAPNTRTRPHLHDGCSAVAAAHAPPARSDLRARTTSHRIALGGHEGPLARRRGAESLVAPL